MTNVILSDVLNSLVPNSHWSLVDGHEYENLEWYSNNIEKPSKEACENEKIRLQTIRNNNDYKEKRAAEYPPMTDYLDALVKNDQEQIQNYIDKCLTVKNKYPKTT